MEGSYFRVRAVTEDGVLTDRFGREVNDLLQLLLAHSTHTHEMELGSLEGTAAIASCWNNGEQRV